MYRTTPLRSQAVKSLPPRAQQYLPGQTATKPAPKPTAQVSQQTLQQAVKAATGKHKPWTTQKLVPVHAGRTPFGPTRILHQAHQSEHAAPPTSPAAQYNLPAKYDAAIKHLLNANTIRYLQPLYPRQTPEQKQETTEFKKIIKQVRKNRPNLNETTTPEQQYDIYHDAFKKETGKTPKYKHFSVHKQIAPTAEQFQRIIDALPQDSALKDASAEELAKLGMSEHSVENQHFDPQSITGILQLENEIESSISQHLLDYVRNNPIKMGPGRKTFKNAYTYLGVSKNPSEKDLSVAVMKKQENLLKFLQKTQEITGNNYIGSTTTGKTPLGQYIANLPKFNHLAQIASYAYHHEITGQAYRTVLSDLKTVSDYQNTIETGKIASPNPNDPDPITALDETGRTVSPNLNNPGPITALVVKGNLSDYKNAIETGRLASPNLNNPDPIMALGVKSNFIDEFLHDLSNMHHTHYHELSTRKSEHTKIKKELEKVSTLIKQLQSKQMPTAQLLQKVSTILRQNNFTLPKIFIFKWLNQFANRTHQIDDILQALQLEYHNDPAKLEQLKKVAQAAKAKLHQEQIEFDQFIYKLVAAGLVLGTTMMTESLFKLSYKIYNTLQIAYVRLKTARKEGVSRHDIQNLQYNYDTKEWTYDIKGKEKTAPPLTEQEEEKIAQRAEQEATKQLTQQPDSQSTPHSTETTASDSLPTDSHTDHVATTPSEEKSHDPEKKDITQIVQEKQLQDLASTYDELTSNPATTPSGETPLPPQESHKINTIEQQISNLPTQPSQLKQRIQNINEYIRQFDIQKYPQQFIDFITNLLHSIDQRLQQHKAYQSGRQRISKRYQQANALCLQYLEAFDKKLEADRQQAEEIIDLAHQQQ